MRLDAELPLLLKVPVTPCWISGIVIKVVVGLTVSKSVCEKRHSHPNRDREGAVFWGAERPLPYGRGSETDSHTHSLRQDNKIK